MNVLFVSHSSGISGAEVSLLRLLTGFDRDQIKPIVVLPSYGLLADRLKASAIEYHIVYCPWWQNRSRFSKWNIFRHALRLVRETVAVTKLRHIMNRRQIDLVYSNSSVVFSGSFAAKLEDKPHIWHIREFLTGNPTLTPVIPIKWYKSIIDKYSSKIICNSNATAKQFVKDGIKNNKITVVYNGIPIEEFSGTGRLPVLQGISGKDWIAVMVGKIDENKGINTAISAIKTLKTRGINLKLLLIGGGNESYVETIRHRILDKGLQENVVLAGYRSDFNLFLPHCKCLLMPSKSESFGVSAASAMAAKIPVIASNIGGLVEIVKDGITGFLVPVDDHKTLATKVEFLYTNPAVANKMGEQGYKRAQKLFSMEAYVKNVSNIIKKY